MDVWESQQKGGWGARISFKFKARRTTVRATEFLWGAGGKNSVILRKSGRNPE